jgi:hypothetical protein
MDGQQQQLVSELCRVKELVRELDLHLHAPYSSYSVDQCRRLAAEIVALTDRSIGIAAAATTPPCSGAPSPLSDAGSDPHHPFSPKRRKAVARWSGQVRVGCAADDGHSWRKYGQKDILGTKHPRAYYRCTHRNSQGCPATKQVQRTDDDPAAFDVVYHGDHTCRGGGARRTQTQHSPHAEGLGARLTVATDPVAAVPPMTPESCAPHGAPLPWSLVASPVGSDSNNVYPCPVAWPSSDGELQEVVSPFVAGSGERLDTELMSSEYFCNFDYQDFDIGTIDPMPSLF